jgi:hypothetical protein
MLRLKLRCGWLFLVMGWGLAWSCSFGAIHYEGSISTLDSFGSWRVSLCQWTLQCNLWTHICPDDIVTLGREHVSFRRTQIYPSRVAHCWTVISCRHAPVFLINIKLMILSIRTPISQSCPAPLIFRIDRCKSCSGSPSRFLISYQLLLQRFIFRVQKHKPFVYYVQRAGYPLVVTAKGLQDVLSLLLRNLYQETLRRFYIVGCYE